MSIITKFKGIYYVCEWCVVGEHDKYGRVIAVVKGKDPDLSRPLRLCGMKIVSDGPVGSDDEYVFWEADDEEANR